MSKRRERRKKAKHDRDRKIVKRSYQRLIDRKRKVVASEKYTVLSFDEDKKDREEKGIIQCWSCGRSLQAPEWIRVMAEQNDGEKTNKCSIECKCGESTDYKF